MGNHKFKLSDMMPNAWFYKLRDMNKHQNQNPKTRKLLPPPPLLIQNNHPRKSYYHSIESRQLIHNSITHDHFPTSSQKRAKRKTIYMPSAPGKITPPPADHVDMSEFDSFDGGLINYYDQSRNEEVEEEEEEEKAAAGLSSLELLSSSSSSTHDIIIDVDEIISYGGAINNARFTEFDVISESGLNLPPIVTNNNKPTNENKNSSVGGPNQNTGPGARKSVSRSRGSAAIRRGNHGSNKRMVNNRGRRRRRQGQGGEEMVMAAGGGLFYSESFAIVKASVDPERDFRESMMEMIVENNMRAWKDLEDLLACYLSLNSNQYHGLIIKAFQQIWFNIMPHQPHF